MRTVIEMRDAVRDGEVTAQALVQLCLDRIYGDDKKIGAFLETYNEEALAAARRIDEMKTNGEDLPRLAGVPIAIKDNLCYAGHTTSCGSKMLEDYTATYTSTAVQRLIDAGAIIIGRTNMDEFAMGSSTETSYFQKTRNPVDPDRVPGGSSGGSAAAVVAGFVPAALGSDTGGSIRQPASLCGVVGLKPTYGRVSRYGLVAMASSLDQIGPIAHTVEDCALLLEVIEGRDDKDATSLELPDTTVAELLEPSLRGVKIGVAEEFFAAGMDPEIEKLVKQAITDMEEQGAEIVKLSLPIVDYALPTYYIIQPAETSSNLGRFDGLRYGTRAQTDNLSESYLKARGAGFGAEVKRRIMLGTYILSAGYYDAYYKKALTIKTAIAEALQKAFTEVDILVLPTSPSVAWRLGEKFDDPIAMYLADIYTVLANIASLPAISVPCGEAGGLPVGLQIVGPYLADDRVLNAAAAYQQISTETEA